jgi:glutamyl-tRNA synthetase
MSASNPIGRLAPSPTGAQHIGNARTYLLAWLSIRAQGGKLILRMEDIDSPRVKPGAAQQALTDLRWLGLDWEEGPDQGGEHAPYVQTERLDLYAAALQRLKQAERVYPCTCSRSDVEAAASAPHAFQEGSKYAGTCAGRRSADSATIQDRPYAWRFRVSDQRYTLNDRVAGPFSCEIQDQLGDFVVAKVDGSPAYQLAVVVDDHAMGITEVVRGDDLLPSAVRQLDLYSFFGWQPPQFAHVPLVIGVDGRRLAKRHGDTRLALLRERGVPSERLIGLLAWSCGLAETTAPITARELIPRFSWQWLPRTPFVFTPEMLARLLTV